jgi:nickel/cobalt transporter (NicO) family protein
VIDASLGLVSIGFTLGMVHALDADHVMAVSAMSNDRPGVARTLGFCANWALGHGGVLMISGVLLFGFGVGIPESFAHLAELFVGVFLIAMGLLCFWRFRRERIRLSEHRHGDVVHLHWQVEGSAHADAAGDGRGSDRVGRHTPVMVGVMHGLAGSAPALALIPVVVHGDLLTALAYLALFSLGVMLAMVIFGLGFGATQRFLQQRYLWIFNSFRNLVAAGSILLGSYWIVQAW